MKNNLYNTEGQNEYSGLLNKRRQVVVGILILLIVIIIVGIIPFILWIIQPSLFFGPHHDEDSYRKLQQIDSFEEIKIDNDGKLIDGWLFHNVTSEKAPLVILYGGNMQNSSRTCLSYYNNSIFGFFEGYNFLMMDYPEFGLSEGKISQESMFGNALAVYDYASNLECVDEDKIVIMGYSIGSGIASYVASQREVNGLILLAPYDELRSIYNEHINIFYGPMRKLIRYDFRSFEYAQSISVSPLIFTSYDDEVISYKFTDNLTDYFDDVYYYEILNSGVKHNDYMSQDGVLLKIDEYLLVRSIKR